MKPYIHAKCSVRRYGGIPEDYLPIHDFMDSTKAAYANLKHRAILHNTFGIYLAERVFGTVITNSDGKIEEARGEAQSLLLKKKAEAEGNLIVSQSLTSELVQYEMAKRWTGELPRMMGSGAVPFINMNLDKPEKKAE